MDESRQDSAAQATRMEVVFRLFVGAVQGVALYLLYRAADARLWPATNAEAFAALALVSFFVPLIAIQAARGFRLRTLALWMIVATVLLAVIGVHDRARLWSADLWHGSSGIDESILPRFACLFFSAVWIFITHSLIGAAEADRRVIADYRSYFAFAWKAGVQVALSACFVAAFWLLLWLGAELFNLIGLDFLEKLIEHAWFAIPASALATAGALHLTDVSARLIAGIRNVALVLLSWLLPIMAVFALGFLASLFFTGLDPLWATRSAAAILLLAAAALVILINAAFQDGSVENRPNALLRLSASLAALTLVPIVALTAYALWLRVAQYGWTEDRVAASVCTLVAASYAFGYAFAALRFFARRESWFASVEPVNVASSFLVVAVLVLIFSPLVDPMRIAVASQVGRLQSGKVSADKFDFSWLRYNAGIYGHDALVTLAKATGPNASDIRKRATAALALKSPYAMSAPALRPLAQRLNIYPRDHLLPQSLLKQDWTKSPGFVPPCLRFDEPCDVFVADLDGDGRDEFIFVSGPDEGWTGAVLQQDASGRWVVAGMLSWPHCKPARDALRKGQYAVVAPRPPKWRSLDAGNTRLEIIPPDPSVMACPR